MNAYSIRLERFRSELKWLFCELYYGRGDALPVLEEKMQAAYTARPAKLRERDGLLMNNPGWYRMAAMQEKFADRSANVGVLDIPETPETAEQFLEVADRFFALSAKDLDAVRVTGVDRLFIIPNTEWQHRQKTHDFTRILRILNDIVSPSVLLTLNMVQPREEVSAFFGQQDRPEFHMIDDRAFVPALWNTVATQDTRVLADEVRQHAMQPKYYVFTRSLNRPEGFAWELDYAFLDMLKMQKETHCKYLNDFFTKRKRGEKARAKALKNASGETVGILGDTESMVRGDVKLNELIHAVLFMQSGIPLLPEEKAGKTDGTDASLKRKFSTLLKLRRSYHAFDANADVWTMDTDNNAILGIGRYKEGQKFYGFFNFSPEAQVFTLRDPGQYENLLNGKELNVNGLVRLPAYGYAWLFRENG